MLIGTLSLYRLVFVQHYIIDVVLLSKAFRLTRQPVGFPTLLAMLCVSAPKPGRVGAWITFRSIEFLLRRSPSGDIRKYRFYAYRDMIWVSSRLTLVRDTRLNKRVLVRERLNLSVAVLNH